MKMRTEALHTILKGKANQKGLSGPVINLSVGVLVAAFVLPIALDEFFGVNTDAWSTSAVSIWDALPVIGLVGLLLVFLAVMQKRR